MILMWFRTTLRTILQRERRPIPMRTISPRLPLNNPDFYHHAGDCLFTVWNPRSRLRTATWAGSTISISRIRRSPDYLYQDLQGLGRYGISDGIRVDAARSVPKSWLATFERGDGVPHSARYSSVMSTTRLPEV